MSLRQPPTPTLFQDVLSVRFMVQFRMVVVVSPYWAGGLSPYKGGGGGYGPSFCEPGITVPEDKLPYVYMLCCM